MAKYQLQTRERYFLIGCVAFLVAVALYFGIQPMYEAYKRSNRDVEAARMNYSDAQIIRNEIVSARDAYEEVLEVVRTSRANFDLYSFLHTEAQKAGMTPTLNSVPGAAKGVDAVDVNVKGASLEGVVSFLHGIYNSNHFIVLQKMDKLEPSQDGKGLEFRMTFISPRL